MNFWTRTAGALGQRPSLSRRRLRLSGSRAVGYETFVRCKLKICPPRCDLEQRREILVTETVTDEAHNDLVREGRQRQWHVAMTGSVESELEVFCAAGDS